MPKYTIIEVPVLYLNEFIRLGQFIRANYDWTTKSHLVKIEDGLIGTTKEYKGKIDGHMHQILQDITIKIRQDITDDKRKELDDILNA